MARFLSNPGRKFFYPPGNKLLDFGPSGAYSTADKDEIKFLEGVREIKRIDKPAEEIKIREELKPRQPRRSRYSG